MTPWIAYAKEILDDDLLNEFYEGSLFLKVLNVLEESILPIKAFSFLL